MAAIAHSGLDAESVGTSLAQALRGNWRKVATAAVVDGLRVAAPQLSDTIGAVVGALENADGESDVATRASALYGASDADSVSALLDLLHAVNDAGLRGTIVVDQIERASDTVTATVLAVARDLPTGWSLIVAANDETPAGVQWLKDHWPDFAYANAERLELQALERPAVEEWYLHEHGELPDNDELSRVMIGTQGRPLVLEEWITGKSSVNELPGVWSRLGPYYAARIGALPPPVRSLLRKLAMFPEGSALDFSFIHAISGNSSTQETLDTVTQLVDGLFLEPVHNPLSDDTRYAFRHTIIQLHALHGLPPAVRQELAISVLSRLQQSPQMEEGLRSWSLGRLAIAAADDDSGPETALRAGRTLLSRGLFIDASELLREAADTFQGSGSASRMTVAYAEALIGLGRYEAALEVLDGLEERSAEHLLATGRALLRLNRYDGAIEALTSAKNGFLEDADTEGACSAERDLITIERDLGHYDLAVSRSLDLLSQVTDQTPDHVTAAIQRTLARSFALSGDTDKAVRAAEIALQLAEPVGPSATATATLALGEAHRHARRIDDALVAYTESARVARLTGNRDCYLWAVLGAGDSLRIAGRQMDARSQIDEALSWVQTATDSHPLEALHFGLLAALLESDQTPIGEPPGVVDLVLGYEALGIDWPSRWLSEAARLGYDQPLPF